MQIDNKRIPYLNLIPIILISFILYRIVNSPAIISDFFYYITSIFSYIIWAFAIAYLLNPLMVFIEKKFKLNRYLSITIIYFLFVSIVSLIVIYCSPSVVNNIMSLYNKRQVFISNTQQWYNNLILTLNLSPDLNITKYLNDNSAKVAEISGQILNTIFNFILNNTLAFTSSIVKFIFGLLLSIYLLLDKEGIIEYIKRLMFAFMDNENSKKIIEIGRKINVAFSKYIIGKIIDSIIVGIITFIVLLLIGVPYATLISLIVGFTNIIPYIGGIFGMIPAVVITFFYSPIAALWVLIALILIQQFDGWYLSPKIIGDSIGLSPILIIAALLAGGALFGIIGMFISIPITAVLKNLLDLKIEKNLKKS